MRSCLPPPDARGEAAHLGCAGTPTLDCRSPSPRSARRARRRPVAGRADVGGTSSVGRRGDGASEGRSRPTPNADQRSRAKSRLSVASQARSAGWRQGRGWLRRRISSSWRNTRISISEDLRIPVDQCTAYACPVQPYASAAPTKSQPRTGSSAAARAALPCTRVPYATLIRPREIHPRNSHLRRVPERETAGQAPAPLHEVRA